MFTGGEASATEKVTLLYVSPNGSDGWSGRLPDSNSARTDGPFATLKRARDVVRELRQNGADSQFTVLVRGGTYRLSEPLTLGPEDSGTESAPFTIKAFGNERPILTGSKPITGFTPVKGQILKAFLRDTSFGPHDLRQVFALGKRQLLARYPDFDPHDPVGGGYLYAEDSVDKGSRTSFKFREGAVPDWADYKDAEVVVYPGPNYWNDTISVAAIDRHRRIITLAKNASYPIMKGNRFFFQNILEALDSPGQWCFDRRQRALYYWPISQEAQESVSVPVVESIVRIGSKNYFGRDVAAPAYVRIEGLTMEDCEKSAVVVRGAENIVIGRCTILNAGENGIEIQDGDHNAAVGNDIYDVGGMGIKISGGDRRTLTAACHRAENNFIHHIGVFEKTSSAIYCEGVGNVVSHNLIRSVPRVGIWFDGNDHLIEYNHVHDTNQETQDSGSILSCARDWTKRGNVIRFNYVHDSGGYGRESAQEPWQRPFETYGIYLDDWTSGTEVFGNVVTHTKNGGIFIHGGRDNVVENNIIFEGGQAQMVYSSIPPTAEQLPGMFAMVKRMGSEKYPLLADITNLREGTKMSGNRFLRNIVSYGAKESLLYDIHGDMDFTSTVSDYNIIDHSRSPLLIPYLGGAGDLQWKEWRDRGLDKNSIIAASLFDLSKPGIFQFAPHSLPPGAGFQRIPLESIGPYQDSMRASWPLPE